MKTALIGLAVLALAGCGKRENSTAPSPEPTPVSYEIPFGAKKFSIVIRYQWANGRIEYIITTNAWTPLIGSLNKDIDKAGKLYLRFVDKNGFEVENLLPSWDQMEKGRNGEFYIKEGNRMDESTFKRIATAEFGGRFSEELNSAIEKAIP